MSFAVALAVAPRVVALAAALVAVLVAANAVPLVENDPGYGSGSYLWPLSLAFFCGSDSKWLRLWP